MRQTYGGDTFNTAVYLARCGRAAGPAGRLCQRRRRRPAQRRAAAALASRRCGPGPGAAHPRRLPGLYQIAVDARGERHFSYWRDAERGTRLLRRRQHAAGSRGRQHGRAVLQRHQPGHPAAGRARTPVRAGAALRARGALVVFDNNYRPRLWADAATARANYQRVYALASLALVTLDDEAALWDGVDNPTQRLAASLDLPCPEVVVKRGAASTLVRSNGSSGRGADRARGAGGRHHRGRRFVCRRLSGRAAGRRGTRRSRSRRQPAGGRVVQHRGAVIPLSAMQDLLAAA